MPKNSIAVSFFNAPIAVGEVSFEVSRISSVGDLDFPILSIPVEITVVSLTSNQIKPPVRPVSLLRISAELESPANRVVARFQHELGIRASPNAPVRVYPHFQIPIDLRTITKIEESRGPNDLQCILTLMILVAVHNADLNGGGAEQFFLARVSIPFGIPRSQWVDLLPRFGYGGLELLEVRYGTGVIAFHLPKSVDEIQLAKKYLRENDWDKAVTHCRRAVEVILESRPSTLPVQTQFRVKVETFIADHLNGLEDRQAKLLAEQMRMIWEIGSQVAHANPIPPCKRPDAEFVVRATMALVEYFSKLLS